MRGRGRNEHNYSLLELFARIPQHRKNLPVVRVGQRQSRPVDGNRTGGRILSQAISAFGLHERGRCAGGEVNNDTRYNKVYDAYYNVNTREWLEEPCGDDDCEFCARRPDLAPMEE